MNLFSRLSRRYSWGLVMTFVCTADILFLDLGLPTRNILYLYNHFITFIITYMINHPSGQEETIVFPLESTWSSSLSCPHENIEGTRGRLTSKQDHHSVTNTPGHTTTWSSCPPPRPPDTQTLLSKHVSVVQSKDGWRFHQRVYRPQFGSYNFSKAFSLQKGPRHTHFSVATWKFKLHCWTEGERWSQERSMSRESIDQKESTKTQKETGWKPSKAKQTCQKPLRSLQNPTKD